MAKPLDLTGQKYGRLTAVNNTGKKNLRNFIWNFKCDCGSTVELPSGEVRRGRVGSCGCLGKELARERMKKIQSLGTEAAKTHGMTNTRTFVSWDSMKQRCLNPNHKSYCEYGGKGVEVCDRWINSFENFLADMGERPIGTTLDRKDGSLGYTPENCRWATFEQQGNNRKTNVFLEHDGKKLTVTQWSKIVGISNKAISYRLKSGWSVKDALTISADHANKKR